MKREIIIHDIIFYIGNYSPRKNEYEKGIKYKLYVDNVPTSYTFNTIKECRLWIKNNYFIFL